MKEKTKQETLEEAADNWVRKPVIGTKRESFIEGAKWQAERMYSEEDMKKAFNSSSLTSMLDVYDSFEEFIKQFKNK